MERGPARVLRLHRGRPDRRDRRATTPERAGIARWTRSAWPSSPTPSSATTRIICSLGGLGFLLGDGNLNYGRENIVESYYNWHAWRGLFYALDVQHIDNPGYNRDRGPAWVGRCARTWISRRGLTIRPISVSHARTPVLQMSYNCGWEVRVTAARGQCVLVYDIGGSHISAALCFAVDYALDPVHQSPSSRTAIARCLHRRASLTRSRKPPPAQTTSRERSSRCPARSTTRRVSVG